VVSTLKPYAEWSTADDRKHSLWKLPSATLSELFANIECLYVLDGHHRLKAATEWYEQSSFNPNAQWAQVLIYPARAVSIYPFHRILEECEQFNFLKYTNSKGIKHVYLKNADESTLQDYDVLYKTQDGFYGFNLESQSDSEVDKLSVQKLKLSILDGLYGDNLERRVEFVPGVINWNELNSKYNTLCMVKPIAI